MATGTFHWTPDYVYGEEIGFKNNIIPYESGKEVRFKRHAFSRKLWTLNFTNITLTEVQDIEAFFKLHHGAHTSFNWTNPTDSTAYTARFENDSLGYVRVIDNIYNLSLKIHETHE